MTRDDEAQLDLLRIFYFVMAGFHVLGGLFFGLYTAFGLFFASVGPRFPDGASSGPPVGQLGLLFAGIGVVGLVVMISITVCQVLVGQRLKERRSHTFVLVCAVLTCLSFPLGTLLGVFTLIVINRPAVKAAFQPA